MGVLLMSLGVLSVLTVLFGNILALRQNLLKRLVAFSSLGHSGYLLMALVGIFSLKLPDFFPLFYYLSAYIFMTGGAFACIQCLEEKKSRPELKDMEGLFKTNPLFALAFSLFLLGLAGMPPLFGFFAKVALFKASNCFRTLVDAFLGIGCFRYRALLLCQTSYLYVSGKWPLSFEFIFEYENTFYFLCLQALCLGHFSFNLIRCI